MFLLDVNALVALCWSSHEHHASALGWFKEYAKQGWATCAFTQAAFVRVILQPAFSGEPLQANQVIELLARTTAHPKHRYCAIDFDIRRVREACTGGLLGHRQITDAWVLTTAIRHDARLLTVDRRIASMLATQAGRAALLMNLEA